MSQFQQPNRRPAPGVVDLGTGRQANMESRNLNVGAIGSRGVTGGQSLRGTDSAVEANRIDPVGYLMGEAAQGMSNFVSARKEVKASFERRGQRQLADLEARRTADIDNGLDEETVNTNHRKRLSELRASGEIDKDLDAFAALNKSFVAADKATDTDIAKRELKALELKLAESAHSPSARIKAIDSLRTKYKGTQVGDILSDRVDSMYSQAVGAKTQIEFQRDVRATNLAVTNQHNAEMTSAGVLLSTFNAEGIVLTDSDAQARITDLYIDKYYGTALEAASPENRDYIRELAIEHLTPIIAKDMGIAQQEIERNNVVLEHMNATAELDTLLQEDTAMFDTLSSWGAPTHRQQTSVSFSRAASLSYDQTDRKLPKGEYMYNEVLLKQGISLARNADDPIEAMRRLRGVMPEDLQSAVDLGWVPEGATQEAWDTKRSQWMDKLRTAQLEASKGAFSAAAGTRAGDVVGLLELGQDLVDMAGYDGPLGLTEDGNAMQAPTGLSTEGEAYNEIWGAIQRPLTKALEASKDAEEMGFVEAVMRSGDLDMAADATLGPDKKLPEESTLSRSALLRYPSEAQSLDEIEAFYSSFADPKTGVLPPFFHEYKGLVDRARKSNIDPSNPAFRGMLHGIGIRAWQNGAGKTTGIDSDSGLRIVVPSSTRTFITNAFDGHKGGPLDNDIAAIATLYETLDVDAREEVFGKHLADARLTAAAYKRDGKWDEETLSWEGVSLPEEITIEHRRDGWADLTRVGKGLTPDEMVQHGVDMILDPTAALAAAGDMGDMDPVKLSVFSELAEIKDGIVDRLTEDLGIDVDETPEWGHQVAQFEQGIGTRVALALAADVGQDPTLAQNSERLAKRMGEHLEAEFGRAFRGMTSVGGQLHDDPTGAIARAAKDGKDSSSQGVFDHFLGGPWDKTAEAVGRDTSNESQARTLFAMFPTLDETLAEPDALVAEASRIAGSRTVTGKDMLAAYFSLSDAPINPDAGVFRDVQLDTRRINETAVSSRFLLPNAAGGSLIGNLEFVPPVHIEDGRTVRMPKFTAAAKTAELRTGALQRSFKKADTDGDGTLSPSEISAYEDSVTTKAGAIDRFIGVKGQRTAGAPRFIEGDTADAAEARAKKKEEERKKARRGR